jgi:hypothetical protein
VEADLQRFLAPLEQRGILERRGKGRCRKSRVSLLPAILLKMIVAILPRGKARIAALLALARISFHLSGWPATVAAWKRQFPVRNHGHAFDQESARAIDEAVCTAAAHSPLGVNCKERALCCWALAREAGCPAELVIGVELFPLSGHCWCEAGPWVVSDHADKCARYIPALRYA